MRLLLIDTCGATGSVALAETGAGQPLPRQVDMGGRTSAERLVPAIRELMATAGLGLAQLDCIAVVHGPGSFTGIRIGVSAAKGIAEATGVPIIALSRLAVVASKFLATRFLTTHDDWRGEALHVALDAGRGEFYHGAFRCAHGTGGVLSGQWQVECDAESLLTREQLMAEVGEQGSGALVVVCEASVALALSDLRPEVVVAPAALDALSLAVQAFHAGLFADVELLDGNYLRRSELEMLARQKMHAERGPST